MRYVLIQLKDVAPAIGAVKQTTSADELSDTRYDALARAFERALQTGELLVTYAVGLAGKPSQQ